MKRKKAIDFLTVTFFFGILLTFTIYLGLGAIIGSEGGIGGDGGSIIGINSVFTNDNAINSFVRQCDYRIFNHIDDSDVIIGEDDWLFEAIDSQNGYERLLDYVGGLGFSNGQLESIARNISEKREKYSKNGIEYMVVVVPDSITVCSDKVPGYLGGKSEASRLSRLNAYLSGESSFIDPTEAMKQGRDELPMYNNTENSINSYGAYCIYNATVSHLLGRTGQEIDRIHDTDVEFFTTLTDGRYIAESRGLSHAVKNRTVSLSDNMPYSYRVVSNEKNLVITERTGNTARRTERVAIECSDEWIRTQLMPYFSNTFDVVYYTNGGDVKDATVVIKIVHESEIVTLADRLY